MGADVNRRALTVCVILATIMQSLDITIANVALPHMQGSLSAGQDQIQWVLSSYVVAAAIVMPLTGFLTVRFGRKRVYLVTIAGFTVTSILCGIATTLPEMVFYRLLQGAFGAPLVPLAQASMFDMNPQRRGSAMAMFGVGIMLGPILGPTLGGMLTEYYNWRFVFYINLPIGILAFIGLTIFHPETAPDRARRFDWFGFLALGTAIGALQLILDRGQQLDWFDSNQIVAAAVIGCLAFYLFIVHTLTAEHSFVDTRVFADRNFTVGMIFIAVVGVNLLASLALITPYMQNLMGYPALTAGFLLAPRGIGTMAAMIIVGRLIGRIDARLLIAFGLATNVLFLWEMAGFTPDVSPTVLFRNGLLQGFGLGFLFVPVSTTTFSSMPAELRPQGTSLYNLMRNLGSSAGIAVVFFVFARNSQTLHAALAEQVTPYNGPLRQGAGGSLWDLTTTAGRFALDGEITRQAEIIAYSNDYRLLMAFVILTAPLVLLLRPVAPPPTVARTAMENA